MLITIKYIYNYYNSMTINNVLFLLLTFSILKSKECFHVKN